MNSLKQKLSPYLPWLMWAVAATFYFYNFVVRVLPSIITTDLITKLHTTPMQLAQIVSIYYVSYTLMQIPIGIIVDRYGIRAILTFGSAICVIAMGMFTQLHSYPLVLLSRLLLGFGTAFAFICAIKIVRIWMPEKHLGLLTSITNTLGMLGAMSCFIILTPLVERYGWNSVAYQIIIFSIVLTLIIALITRDRNHPDAKENVSSFKELWHQVRGMLRDRPILFLNGVIGCLCALPTTVFPELWSSLYFTQALHFSMKQAAFATSLIFLGWSITSPIFGRVSDYLENFHLPLIFGLLGTVVSFLVLLSYPFTKIYSLYTACFIFGAFASCEALVFPIACQLAPLSTTGTAVAITNAFVAAGSVIFQPIVSGILQNSTPVSMHDLQPIYSAHTYFISFSSLLMAISLSLILAMIQYVLHRKNTKSISEVA